jgi:hypothetical protein
MREKYAHAMQSITNMQAQKADGGDVDDVAKISEKAPVV